MTKPSRIEHGIRSLERGLGYEFKNHELIVEALTHRSHFHEFNDSPHNERLEFLGDTVIDLCVAEMLMREYPNYGEGDLSKLRSQRVSEKALAQLARHLDLGSVIRLGRGEDLSKGRERDALLADTLEAVVAAVYLDGGFGEVQRVISTIMKQASQFSDVGGENHGPFGDRNFKSKLQELCQSEGFGAPQYQCLATKGPDHRKLFTMALFIRGVEVIRADGVTKKEATQEAARMALDELSRRESLADYLAEFHIEANSELSKKATPTS